MVVQVDEQVVVCDRNPDTAVGRFVLADEDRARNGERRA